MKLIFLREEIDEETSFRTVHFSDADTSHTYTFYHMNGGQSLIASDTNKIMWFYRKGTSVDTNGQFWMNSDDLSNGIMDSLIKGTMPFKE